MTTRRPTRAILSALLCAGAPLITAAPAQATTFPVGCGPTRVADLVAAIANANANGAGADTITLAAGCTYTFTAPHNYWYGPNALPAIASTITIEGNGAVIERDAAAPKFRLFYVGADPNRAETLNYTTPGAGDLTLRNLTVRGGLAKGGDSGYGGGGGGMGGALFSQGRVSLTGVTMTANTAQGGSGNVTGGYGGGGIGTDVGGGGGNGGGFGPGSFGGSAGGTTASKAGGGGGGFRPTDNGAAAIGVVAGLGGGPANGTGGGGGRGSSVNEPGALGGNGAGGGGGYANSSSASIGGAGGGFGFGGSIGPGGGGGGGVGGGGGASNFSGGAGGGGFGGGGGLGNSSGYGGHGGFGGGGGSAGSGGGLSTSPGSGGFGGGTGSTGVVSGGGGAGMGGAIFNHQGVLTVANSTLAANTAVAGTGANPGQGMGGAVFNLNGTATLTGATVAANTAAQDGGAIHNLAYDKFTARAASVTLVSSILADSAPGGVADLVSDAPATVADGGTNLSTASVAIADHNLVERRAFSGSGTISGLPLTADPGLGALAANGGLTPTMAVGISSPVVDKGVAGGLTTDQRGQPRPVDLPGVANTGDASDIGAFELTLPAESQFWVANESANRVTRYAAGTVGNAAPAATIEGAATGLSAPSGVAVDGGGRLYVANQSANSVSVYAPSANGNAAPLYSIAGAGTGLSSPRTLVVDSSGRLYVANAPANTVTVYGPGASGAATPVATLTGLSNPMGLALDAAGRVYVSNQANSTVVVFNPGATGAAVPVLTISAGLSGPQGLVVDAGGVIWVTNTNNNTVTRYSAAGALLGTISGSGLNLPAGIALDASGRVVVSNFSGASLMSFSGTALVNSVFGPATLFAGPIGVAAVPVVTVTTATPLPEATVGTPYSQSLTAAGGTGPYTWALASGSLPAGLSLSSAGVVSGTPTARGTFPFSVTVTDSASPAHSTTFAMSLRSGQAESQVWVANESANRVIRYAAGATGNVAPLASIEGAATGLNKPSGVAVDGGGRLYVANQNAHSVTVYAPNATGNVAPLFSIAGAGTGLVRPRSLALDSTGRLYVANLDGHTVTVYAPGASGNATPVATITGLSSPLGVALDAGGKLYVSNGGDSTVRVFNPGATGAAVPVLTISSGLSGPQGLVVDTTGVIWVTNTNNNTVTRYSAAGALLDTISGSGLSLPAGIALDAGGRVVVSNFSGASLMSFSGTALVNTVVGGNTLLAGPIGVATVPVVTVTTATPLPDAAVGTPYSQSLGAAGGTGPYTWALAAGSLPAGLSLSSAGVVSGTPTARGTSAFSVTVTDSANPAHSTTYAMSLRSRETDKPTCTWSIQTGPKRVVFTVTDAGAGLAMVQITTAVNIVQPVNVPVFTVGRTAPISFSALKADQTKSSQVAVVITDVDGNQASCT